MNSIKKRFILGSKGKTRAGAIAASLVASALLLLIVGGSQRGAALYSFFVRPIVSLYGWREMIGGVTVYLLVAVGICVMFQCQQLSLISEGSFLAGACVTTFFLLNNNTQPSVFLLVMGIVLGILMGQLTGAIPAFLHAKRGVNVTLASAVTNFFVLEITTFFLQRYMSDPAIAGEASYAIPGRMQLPYLYRPLGIRLGTLLAVLCAAAAYLVLYRTRRGYEIRTVGANRNLAAYIGLSSGSIIVFSQLFAGGMAGLAGAVQMMGISSRYVWNGQFSNIGTAAILIAVLADCNPLWVAPSALLFAYLDVGGRLLAQQTGLPAELSGLVQALMVGLLFVGKYWSLSPKNKKSRQMQKQTDARAGSPTPQKISPREADA